MIKKRIAIAALAAFTLATSSCKKEWLDVNRSPNDLPVTVSNYIFANAETTTAFNNWGDNSTGTYSNELGAYFAGQWSQSNTYILTTSIFRYAFTNNDFNSWDRLYDNLADYEYVIVNAEKDGQKGLIGPSKVMKAYIYQQLVDMYGNIPYTSSLKGLGSLAPAFEDQQVVYDNLIKLLDEAIVNLKANAIPAAYSGSDVIFKGGVANWIRLANTLKMRILIRQSRVASKQAFIIAEINKIVTEGSGLITADATVNPGYQAQASKQNPIYDRWGYNTAGGTQALGRYPRMSKFLVDNLIATGDTFRLKRLAYAYGGENTAAPGTSVRAEIASNYRGVPFGAASGYTATTVSPIGPSLIVRNQYKAVVLVGAAEAQLLMAEAKERFPAVTLAGTAKSYYDAGVAASYASLGATGSAAALTSNGNMMTDYSAATDKLALLAYQKWVALCNFNGLEAWAEYRRTNLPAIPMPLGAASNLKMPLRLFYPATELGSNTANVQAQGNIDVFSTRIFWDVD